MTFVFCVILFVLLVLAIAVGIHYRNESEKLEAARWADKVAWNEGIDNLEEMYQGEILTIGENWDACQGALEAAHECIEELDAVSTRMATINSNLIESLDREIGDTHALKEELSACGASLEAKDDQLQLVLVELDKYEELYGEASTELLETVTEIDKIAGEVHDWMGKGSPFD